MVCCNEKNCICDLKNHSKRNSDWEISKLVGVNTYCQLIGAAPGVFEIFGDCHHNGNTSNNLKNPFIFTPSVDTIDSVAQPNLISTIFADGGVDIYDIKRMLIRAYKHKKVHPLIEPLINSSKVYENPVMTIGELLSLLIFYTVVSSLLIKIILKTFKIY